jgi:hypothetical protein
MDGEATVMKQLLAGILVLTAVAISVTPAMAQRNSRSVHSSSSVSIFRLIVHGTIARTDTFWVAYGPLQDKWGIIQLHAAGPNLYVARAKLPRGRTVFSFIQGRGVLHTRLGAAAGNPVTTIRQIGPTSALGGDFPLVVWREPIG